MKEVILNGKQYFIENGKVYFYLHEIKLESWNELVKDKVFKEIKRLERLEKEGELFC